MAIASKVIRELLENGVHFGHQTNKWNPKMGKYIFGAKSGIYIIDLKKTEVALAEAVKFLYELALEGKTVLFVGTKKQAKQIIREEAERCEMFFIDERWLGGCLTNFTIIRKSIGKLDSLQAMKESDIYPTLAKKEKVRMDRAENKLLRNLGGIREMKTTPDAIVIVDSDAENIAVSEAIKIGIPVVAMVDTNCDPDVIDYPIPSNDDAIRAIGYIISTLADAVKKGRNEFSGLAEKDAPVTEETFEAKEEEQAEEKPVEIEVAEAEAVETEAAEEKAEDSPAEDTEKTVEEAPVKDEANAEETSGGTDIGDEDIEGDIKLDEAKEK